MDILSGTYRARQPDQVVRSKFKTMAMQLDIGAIGGLFDTCSECGQSFDAHEEKERELTWPADATVFQLSNARWRAVNCIGSA